MDTGKRKALDAGPFFTGGAKRLLERNIVVHVLEAVRRRLLTACTAALLAATAFTAAHAAAALATTTTAPSTSSTLVRRISKQGLYFLSLRLLFQSLFPFTLPSFSLSCLPGNMREAWRLLSREAKQRIHRPT